MKIPAESTRIMIPGKRYAVGRAQVHHCHVKHKEHLLTATEIERISKEVEAQFLKKDGDRTIEIKTSAADAMERNNSPLVTNGLMERQLPPVRGPVIAATVGAEDDALEGGAETMVKAQVDELYIGDAESERG